MTKEFDANTVDTIKESLNNKLKENPIKDLLIGTILATIVSKKEESITTHLHFLDNLFQPLQANEKIPKGVGIKNHQLPTDLISLTDNMKDNIISSRFKGMASAIVKVMEKSMADLDKLISKIDANMSEQLPTAIALVDRMNTFWLQVQTKLSNSNGMAPQINDSRADAQMSLAENKAV